MEGISIPAHPTIRQRIKCRGAIFCARPSMPPPAMLYPTIRQRIKCAGAKYCAPTRWCIPSWQRLYHSHTPPPASFAIHGSSASHRRSFFFGGADFLFSSIPQKPFHNAHKPLHPTQKKEYSLLVLPSVNTILNFATKFFEMFTKKQS